MPGKDPIVLLWLAKSLPEEEKEAMGVLMLRYYAKRRISSASFGLFLWNMCSAAVVRFDLLKNRPGWGLLEGSCSALLVKWTDRSALVSSA